MMCLNQTVRGVVRREEENWPLYFLEWPQKQVLSNYFLDLCWRCGPKCKKKWVYRWQQARWQIRAYITPDLHKHHWHPRRCSAARGHGTGPSRRPCSQRLERPPCITRLLGYASSSSPCSKLLIITTSSPRAAALSAQTSIAAVPAEERSLKPQLPYRAPLGAEADQRGGPRPTLRF
jgi:hypothetical protein